MRMEELKKLCGELDFDPEVTARVLEHGARCPLSRVELYRRLSTGEGERAFRAVLRNDEDGFQMLACILLAGLETRRLYRERGIGDGIFLDTFQCFPRFVGERRAAFGRWGFDRSFWTWRQLGLKLFKVGELEYELTELDGARAVSVHIPSTARLDHGRCLDSYRAARDFLLRHAPEYADTPRFCDSWLLSPALPGLLGPESRILQFQRDYVLREIDPDNREFMMWVYRTENGPLEDLSEDTALRKHMKAFLLSGGKVGSAVGVLNEKL